MVKISLNRFFIAQLRKPCSKVKPQILKVQQITNGRQVLLPLGLKSIKIVNASRDGAIFTHKKHKIEEIRTLHDGNILT